MDDMKLTPTQRRLMAVLGDGKPHKRKELRACLNDELGHQNLLNVHISAIRKKLLPRGETIVCELVGYSINFRYIRLACLPPEVLANT